LVGALAIGGFNVACGGGPHSTTAPTPIAATGSTRVVTGLLTLQRTGTVGPTQAVYELRGDIRFRNEGRAPLHLTMLLADFMDEDGQSERQNIGIDVTIQPGESTAYPFPVVVSLAIERNPVRVRLSARGTSTDGTAAATDSAEAALSMPAPVAPLGGGEATIVAAGDIGDCTQGASLTARLLDTLSGEVFTLGDHVYPSATREGFAGCYESTWGRHKGRTRATPGNHDWGEEGGRPYFEYFGGAAGPFGAGYYSFDIGAWHVLSLNSNVAAGLNSPQFQWATADLMAHPSKCTMAIWHHARFSSGPSGDVPTMQQIWWLLDGNGVDVVLNAHDHLYERFAPQDHEGNPSPNGIRLFVVGTGGAPANGVQTVKRNSEARESAWGVLRMTLRPDSYVWQFVGVPGSSFRDAGSDVCR
jgi:hypothetical protein